MTCRRRRKNWRTIAKQASRPWRPDSIKTVSGQTGAIQIGNLVDKGIAQRQAASRYLHDLAALGVLREMPVGKEKLFVHPKLLELLGGDSCAFEPYV